MRTYSQGQTPNEQLAKPARIVVATDLKDTDLLLPHAIAQAKTCGAHLTLVHAAMTAGVDAFDAGGVVMTPEELRSELKAETAMEDLVARVKAQGISCDSVVTHISYPEDVLPREVRRAGAQRLIMATHGRGKVGQITLGSIAHELLSVLDIPIFAVGPNAGCGPRHCSPKTILHPVSFSEGYQESAEIARNIAELYGAELILMHVLDPDLGDETNPRQTVQWAKQALDDAIPDKTTLMVPLLTHVACGNVVEEILNTAAVRRADWIILGTRHLPKAPLLFNSIAYKVLARANAPVLALPNTVRQHKENFAQEEMPVAIH